MQNTNPHADAHAYLARIRATFGQWVQAADLAVLASHPDTRLTPVLVRCGGCRFTAPAQDAQHLIDIITADGRDYVRDASLAVVR